MPGPRDAIRGEENEPEGKEGRTGEGEGGPSRGASITFKMGILILHRLPLCLPFLFVQEQGVFDRKGFFINT